MLIVLKITGNNRARPMGERAFDMNFRVRIAIVITGFSGLVAEILLLRELLIVFAGNELSIGLILAGWLILEAAGCLLAAGRNRTAQHPPLAGFTAVNIGFSIALILAIGLTRILKNLMGLSIGENMGLLSMLGSTFLILLPVSVLHGALFTISCRIYGAVPGQDADAAGKVYVWETAGTLVGGLICTFFLIQLMNSFQAACWIALINMLACLVLLLPPGKNDLSGRIWGLTAGLLLVVFGYLIGSGLIDRLQHLTVQAQWKNQDVVHYQNSPYGNISVTENQGQYIFFLDGVPAVMTPVPDIQAVESFVHLPLLAHPAPKQILVLSRGAGGVIHEILKHPTVAAITYAEIDPLLPKLLKRFATPLTDIELNARNVIISPVDGRLLLNTTQNRYDVIFVGVPEPASLQANRFFTREFFSLARNRLNQGGILVLGLPGSLTHINQALTDLNSCIYHTLADVFSHIRVFPGEGRHLFLASDAPDIQALDIDRVIHRLVHRQMAAEPAVPRHIDQHLHPGWQNWFSRFLEGGTRSVNHDFRPLGMFYSLSYWNSLYGTGSGRVFAVLESVDLRVAFLACLVVPGLYALMRSSGTRPRQAGVLLSVATSGFTGMIVSLTVIFGFQALHGYLFSWIGILIAAFMAGSAWGALFTAGHRNPAADDWKTFVRIEQGIILFSAALPLMFFAARAGSDSPVVFYAVRMVFPAIAGICGFLTGAQFPLANRICRQKSQDPGRTAALLYSSDLAGGWIGGVTGAVVLLPVLGLTRTCMTLVMLKLTSFIILTVGPGRHQKEVCNET
jgi:spermidine synthase